MFEPQPPPAAPARPVEGGEPPLQPGEFSWRLVANQLADHAVILLDPQGRVAGWNVGAQRILGWAEAEILGRHLAHLFTPEDCHAGVSEEELQIARAGTPAPDERWQLRKDGSRFWASGTVTALRASGQLLGFVKVLRDRTRERQAAQEREQLLARQQEQAHLLEEAHVLVRDLDGRITLWSRGMETQYGFAAEEALGKISHDFLRSKFPRPLAEVEAELLSRGEWEGELTHVRKDGSLIVVASHWALHRDSSGRPAAVLEVNNDVSALKRAQEALREADRHKDEFLAILSHELRNSLAPILTSLQIMRQALPEAPLLHQARSTIERQVHQLARVVEDLLDLSRVSQGKLTLRPEVVDLLDVVHRAVETATPLLGSRHHRLHLRLPSSPVLLTLDPVRVQQALANLLNNAAKYTEPGGDITVAVALETGMARVSVSDTGMGIAPEMLPRVFDLYAQEKRARGQSAGGLGIGLALVRRLVDMHGGTAEAHSDGPGQGSTFTVRLPTRGSAPAGPREDTVETVQALRPRLRLAVVDDNADSADSLTLMLCLWGHDVQTAYTGRAGFEMIHIFRPDVALLDIGLPDMTGHELAEQIRRQEGPVPVLIALSGYGQECDRALSLRAGFHEHLVKPVAPERLEELLASVTR